MKLLDHPNIVRLYEAVQLCSESVLDSCARFIVMLGSCSKLQDPV